MFPKAPPIVGINGGCAVDCPVLEKPCKAKEEAFCSGPVVTKQLKFGSLGEHEKRNLVELVAKGDSKRLEEIEALLIDKFTRWEALEARL